MNNKKIKILFLLFTVLCITFIWYNSFKNGVESSEDSQDILNIILEFLKDIGVPQSISEFAIRKLAHFIEFSGLGFLLVCDLYMWCLKPITHISLVYFIGLLVACIDETIQIFSEGRSSKVTDVFIDFSGVVAASLVTIFLIYILFKILPNGKNLKSNNT